MRRPQWHHRDPAADVDGDKLMQFVFRAVDEVGATLNAALVVMGDKLGLYRALAGTGGLSPASSRSAHRHHRALRARVAERPGRRWLRRLRRRDSGRYALAPEQTVALTDPDSPAYLPGFFQIAIGSVLDSPRIIEAARSGAGVGWHEHVHDVHEGCERFFRPGYNAHLIAEWLPALEGVVEKLQQGGRVADVGCGHGASTILMAQAFPDVDVRRLRLPHGARSRRPASGRAEAGRRRARDVHRRVRRRRTAATAMTS